MQREDKGLSIDSSRETLTCDVAVIGAGSGGLSVAAAAAVLGENVVLVEKHKMGGDCLNYGCVPSKALLAAGKRAMMMRSPAPFGIAAVEPKVDWAAVRAHVAGVIEAIAPNDSAERFSGLGVRVLHGAAKFLDRTTLAVGEQRIMARRFVVASGSTPVVPKIKGLDEVPYFTNETIFAASGAIGHLIVLGGGPIGLEMADAHRNLGAEVTVVEMGRALAKDDPELAAVVVRALKGRGVAIHEGTEVASLSGQPGAIVVEGKGPSGTLRIEGSHLLVAAGRRPNVEDLGLEAAGVAFDRTGIKVNRGQRTTNSRVYAIGDCAQGLKFTHVANYQAGIVIKRALFRVGAKFERKVVPWVTFTEPELAQAGLSEAEAEAQGLKPRVLRWSFHENDRAQAERQTEGHVKVVIDGAGRILGAGIVGPHAGEQIAVWALALSQGLKIKAMTDWIAPYPTLSEASKRAAARAFADLALNARVRKLIQWLKKLG